MSAGLESESTSLPVAWGEEILGEDVSAFWFVFVDRMGRGLGAWSSASSHARDLGSVLEKLSQTLFGSTLVGRDETAIGMEVSCSLLVEVMSAVVLAEDSKCDGQAARCSGGTSELVSVLAVWRMATLLGSVSGFCGGGDPRIIDAVGCVAKCCVDMARAASGVLGSLGSV